MHSTDSGNCTTVGPPHPSAAEDGDASDGPPPPLASGLFFTVQQLTNAHHSASSSSASPAVLSYLAYTRHLQSLPPSSSCPSPSEDLDALPLFTASLPLSPSSHSSLHQLLSSLPADQSTPALDSAHPTPSPSPPPPAHDPSWPASLALYARISWHRHWSDRRTLHKRLLGYSSSLPLSLLSPSSLPLPLLSLPNDLLLAVLSYVPPADLLTFACSARTMAAALASMHVASVRGEVRRVVGRQTRRWCAEQRRQVGEGRRRLVVEWLMSVILTLQCGSTSTDNHAILHLALLLFTTSALPDAPQLAALSSLLLAANALCFAPQHAVLTASQCSFLCDQAWTVEEVRDAKTALGRAMLRPVGGEDVVGGGGGAMGVDVMTLLDWVEVWGAVGGVGEFRLSLMRDVCVRMEKEEGVVLTWPPVVVALAVMALIVRGFPLSSPPSSRGGSSVEAASSFTASGNMQTFVAASRRLCRRLDATPEWIAAAASDDQAEPVASSSSDVSSQCIPAPVLHALDGAVDLGEVDACIAEVVSRLVHADHTFSIHIKAAEATNGEEKTAAEADAASYAKRGQQPRRSVRTLHVGLVQCIRAGWDAVLQSFSATRTPHQPTPSRTPLYFD